MKTSLHPDREQLHDKPSSRTRRWDMKTTLMCAAPYCTCCKKRLWLKQPDGRSGEVSLVALHLFCGVCVNKIRQRPLRLQLEIIKAMKEKIADQAKGGAL